jgi:hypothetical protein
MIPRPFFFAVLLAFCSCSQKDDLTGTVDHTGSIETSIAVQHTDSTHDIVLTTHKVWVNGNVYRTIVHRDTVPGLGLINTAGENNGGDTATVTVRKDYQIFITLQ